MPFLIGLGLKLFGIGKFLIQYWKEIVIAAIVGFLAWTFFYQIPHLHEQIQAQNRAIVEEQRKRADLQATFDTYKTNQTHLMDNVGAQSTILRTQEKITNIVHEVQIPVLVTEKPFNDPGMLARAQRLRDYQSVSPVNQYH